MNLFLKMQNNSTLTTSSMSPRWHTVTNQPFYWWSQAACPPPMPKLWFLCHIHESPAPRNSIGIWYTGCQAREELYQLKNPTNRQGVLSLQVNFISAKADFSTFHLLAWHKIALFRAILFWSNIFKISTFNTSGAIFYFVSLIILCSPTRRNPQSAAELEIR